ncbi:MAG: hypothetical protein H6617_08755 [Bdellovibrionaceae bacterium]|nr:hypothetical protein [Bdellovibrionales bacterium]MCB9254756.1 hypothetical protein [Pseudobdellovibrionaceae bacterium]
MKKTYFLIFAALALVSVQSFASISEPIPEIPTNLVPWIVGGSVAVLLWVRRFFK